MNSYYFLVAFFTLFFQNNSKSQIFENRDKRFLKNLSSIEKGKSNQIKLFFDSSTSSIKDNFFNLGFKWKLLEKEYEGKNIKVNGKFVYYNDSLISYNLKPILFYHTIKRKKYCNWLGMLFEKDSLNYRDYTFNKQAVMKPIAECNLPYKKLTDQQLELMSPYSELDYGFPGSDGISKEGKEKFDSIFKKLSSEETELMFYSLNPITRLHTIEFYLNSLGEKEIPCDKLKLFTKLFNEFSTVNARIGCELVDLATISIFPKYMFQRFVYTKESCQ